MMIGVGLKVKFLPTYMHNDKYTPEERRAFTVTATIIDINWEHRQFTTEFDCSGTKQHESFKFSDIGKAVKLCG